MQLIFELEARPEPARGKSPKFGVEVEVTTDAIYVRTGGREAWLEVNEFGDLVIHAYPQETEAPLNVHVSKALLQPVQDAEAMPLNVRIHQARIDVT